MSGSPPRMRGKAVVVVYLPGPAGITPAYAGKRAKADQGKPHPRDHPRVCGEKVWRDVKRAAKAGSPPRMRGKVYCFIHRGWRCRITPAYAGKRLRKP